MRRSVALLLLLAVLRAAPAGAHAILVRSSIDDRPMVADAAGSVTLRFNAGIEATLSKVVLIDARHTERPLTVGPGASAGELTVDVPALTPGTYGLRYRVLAADGHLTDGLLKFTVAAAR
jgi:methionine-rich copper-binding protein CopC